MDEKERLITLVIAVWRLYHELVFDVCGTTTTPTLRLLLLYHYYYCCYRYLCKSSMGKESMIARAINFVEASESATSDVLRAVRPALGASTAPSLIMIKTFGELLGIEVQGESMVGSSSNFAIHLTKKTNTVGI